MTPATAALPAAAQEPLAWGPRQLIFVDMTLSGLIGIPRRAAAWFQSLGPAERVRASLMAAALLSGAVLAGALSVQYGLGVLPCHLCLVQRYPHFAILGVSLAGLALGMAGLSARTLAGLRALFLFVAGSAFLYTGGYGIFHSGVERGWWPGPASCSGAAMPDSIAALNTLLARGEAFVPCDAAPWTIFGLSLANYNVLISLPAAIAALMVAGGYLRAGLTAPREQHG